MPHKVSQKSKNNIRKEILTLLRSQKEEDRLKKSGKIKRKLFSLPEFKRAKVILFYASFDGEVDTFAMMKQAQQLKKKIALPVIIKDKKKILPRLIKHLNRGLHSGEYGIKAPHPEYSQAVSLDRLDLVVVPGVVFDKDNYRMGRGHGYYDRFLAQLPPETPTVGLAFDFQVVDRLPHREQHDFPVSRVIFN